MHPAQRTLIDVAVDPNAQRPTSSISIPAIPRRQACRRQFPDLLVAGLTGSNGSRTGSIRREGSYAKRHGWLVLICGPRRAGNRSVQLRLLAEMTGGHSPQSTPPKR